MYRPAAAIESWLSQSDNDDASHAPISPSNVQAPQHAHNHSSNCKRKRKGSTEMTPPPMLLQERSMSPKKLKFDVYNTDDVPLLDNLDETLRSPRSPRLAGFNTSEAAPLQARVPSIIPSSASQSYTSVSSNETGRTKRSFSTIKNANYLRYLDKSIIYGHLDDGATQLPADVATLWDSVDDVVANSTCVYPAEIRGEITSLHRRPPPETNFGTATVEARGTPVDLGQTPERHVGLNNTTPMQNEFPDQLPAIWAFARASVQPSVTRQRLALAELRAVQNIIRQAHRCLDGRYCEATWNSKVHDPLLELALFRHEPHVEYLNATSAQILPAFMPSFPTGNAVAGGKMIDFVLTRGLEYDDLIPADVKLTAAIRAKLACQPWSQPSTINQTDYTPLTHTPIAVAIGTTILGASMEEGRVRLAVWTAAWHRRMDALGVTGRGQPLLPTLPLILTMDHSWKLFFACDRGTTIDILGPIDIGSTITIHGIYRLLAVLRLLADWVNDVFYQWTVAAFIPQTEDTMSTDGSD